VLSIFVSTGRNYQSYIKVLGQDAIYRILFVYLKRRIFAVMIKVRTIEPSFDLRPRLRCWRLVLAVFMAVLLLAASPAVAQQAQPSHVSPTALLSPWVSTKSAPVANANPRRTGLYVSNPTNVTIWVSPAGTAAIVNGAGSVPIQPLQGQMFGPPNMPSWTAGMNAIAAQDGPNAITVLEFSQ
jgi:hypothetical protein